MSVQATRWVLDNGPRPGDYPESMLWRYRALLAEVADRADADGRGSHPGMAQLAEVAACHPGTARRYMHRLVSDGWLAVELDGGGRGAATVYRLARMAPETLAETRALTPETLAETRALTPETLAETRALTPETRALHPTRPAPPDPQPVTEQPPTEQQRGREAPALPLDLPPPRTNASKRTRLPDDLLLPQQWRSMLVAAADRTGVALDPDDEFDKFADHHRARGNVMADWTSAWRTWARRAALYERQHLDQRTSASRGRPQGARHRVVEPAERPTETRGIVTMGWK